MIPGDADGTGGAGRDTPATARTRQPCLVLAYDRTESARRAAVWAAGELAPDGKLVIVHSCRPLHAPASPLSSAGERHRMARALIEELLLETEGPLMELDVEAVVSDQDPVSAAIAAAERHGASAIVVGSEQRSLLRRALGTVTGELLNRSPVPVIAVRDTPSGDEGERGEPAGALETPPPESA